MQRTGSSDKSWLNWLGAGLLLILIVGLVYLTMRDRPAEEPETDSPLLVLTSPISVASNSPLPTAVASRRPTLSATLPPAASALPSPTVSPSLPPPLSSPTSQPAPASADAPLRLTVLHTNDTWGYLRPCG